MCLFYFFRKKKSRIHICHLPFTLASFTISYNICCVYGMVQLASIEKYCIWNINTIFMSILNFNSHLCLCGTLWISFVCMREKKMILFFFFYGLKFNEYFCMEFQWFISNVLIWPFFFIFNIRTINPFHYYFCIQKMIVQCDESLIWQHNAGR